MAAIAVEGDTLWAGFGNGTILRIDSRTGRVTRQLRIPGAINFLAVGADSIWALDQFNGIVSRIAESTGMLIAQIHVTGGATEIAAGQKRRLVTLFGTGTRGSPDDREQAAGGRTP